MAALLNESENCGTDGQKSDKSVASTSPEYDCENCGACCRCFPIFASEADAEREPAIKRETRKLEPFLATEDKAYQMHPLPFLESCAFLKEDQLCRIYATRPEVCRRFEAGSEQCIEARARVGIASELEGNDGALPSRVR